MELLTESHLPLKLVASGKVRDIYEVDDDHLLLVATDRVSAFDVVMHEAVRYKGAVLTALSAWWFSQFGNSIERQITCSRMPSAAAPIGNAAQARFFVDAAY
jgi:phosphoribosylaminoimidazole-succinocarboxamide synthase